ncbi:MAG: hypothetical protein ACYCOO_11100 [Chitinophagaceae bacterium]
MSRPRGSQKNRNQSPQKSTGKQETYIGIVDITRSGMAYVMVNGLEKDIIVQGRNLQTALDGDEVRVELTHKAQTGKRMEGIVVEVIKRKKSEFTGKLQVSEKFAFLLPDQEGMMDIYIPLSATGGAKDGDHVVAKIVGWGEKTRKPVGEVTAVLDIQNLNDTAMKEILVENGFPLSFPQKSF